MNNNPLSTLGLTLDQGKQFQDEVSTPQTPFSASHTETLHNGMPVHTESLSKVNCSLQRHSHVGSLVARDHDHANSLASIDCPPLPVEELPLVKIYQPLSIHVLALLAPASIFGVLARLGLQALTTYNGQSIFPLAYVQATGCFIMGIGLRMKVPFGNFYGPLYTAMTTGFCGSLTTFSGWQVDVFDSWVNTGPFHRGGLRDVRRS